MIGKTISHYKVIEKLGGGGMGVVYKAEDTKLKRTVALKFLPPSFSFDEEAKKRFIHEAQTASALEHNNICNIHEIDETNEGQLFISMAFYDGETLKKKIEGGQLKLEEAISITIKVSKGLFAVHEEGIINRDIKPANIFITKNKEVKILDFGLAKVTGQTQLTQLDRTVGTVAYMSPEQTRGETVDQRTDIWALGIVLYEMLTGSLPFKGDYSEAVIYSILNTEPDPLTSVKKDIPPALEKIVSKCLHKNKLERYQKIEKLIKDLHRLKIVEEIDVDLSKKIKLPKVFRKWPVLSTIISVILITSILISFGYFFINKFNIIDFHKESSLEDYSKHSIAVMYFTNDTGNKDLDYWRHALSNLLIADLAQSKYVRVLSEAKLFNILKNLNQLDAIVYSSEILNKIASEEDIKHILVGKYAKSGDKIRINVMLQEASTGELLGSEGVEGTGEENIFQMVDNLTIKIKQFFNLSLDAKAKDVDKDVEQITTSSPEAYKYFSEGYKYYLNAEHRNCIQLMEKAISIDPEFANAYFIIAESNNRLGYKIEGKKNYDKAFEFSDRLPDRKKYRLRASVYSTSEKTYTEAFNAFNKLLELYPDDRAGNHNLGYLYKDVEQWEKAIERFEVLINKNEKVFHPYNHTAFCYMAMGMYEKAREIVEYYQENISDISGVHHLLAIIFLCQKENESALREINKALSLKESLFSKTLKGNIHQCMGEFVEAKNEYQKLLDSEEPASKIYGRNSFAAFYITLGLYEKAIDQIQSAIEITKELNEKEWEADLKLNLAHIYLRLEKQNEALKLCEEILVYASKEDILDLKKDALFMTAYSQIQLNQMDKVEDTANTLKEIIENGYNNKEMRYYYYLMGIKELYGKNYFTAIDFLKKAVSLLSEQHEASDMHAVFYEPLAQCYYYTGDLDKAEKKYKQIINLTTGRMLYGDFYSKSFYMLGKIYQKKGWKGKAIEHYNLFLKLWKDCDPMFRHMLDDAEEIINKLENRR